MSADPFEERLAQIRDRFVASLSGKIEETDAALPGLVGATAQGAQASEAAEAVAAAYQRMHGIAGMGPTVGFVATGMAARQVESVLMTAYREKRGLDPSELAHMRAVLDALRETARAELGARVAQ